ncbi:hypothetical protein ACFLQ5_03875, partial [Bacteroidota bacterium]
LGNDTIVCGSYTLNAGSYSSYLWNNSTTSSTFTVTYSGAYSVTVTNGQCTDVDTITVIVNPATNVNFTGLPTTMCTNHQSVNLIGLPTGGVFSGQGISGNTFNPVAAGLGTHSITYIYTNSYNCTNTITKNVTVYSVPTVTFASLSSSYCTSDPLVSLSGSPSGGTFSGPGVSGNNFNPSIAGVGSHTLFYTYSSANACSDLDSQIVVILTPPTVSLTGLAATYCENSPIDTLIGSPIGGTYSGNGVSGNIFNPAIAGAGTHNITYTFTAANGCSASSIQSVIVHAITTNIIINGLSVDYCENDAAVYLSGTPAGGTFSGNGMSGNVFDPSSPGTGTHTITYSYTNANGCTSSQALYVIVYALPQVSFSGLANSYCTNSSMVSLSGTPTGGTFNGTGISGSNFYPATAGLGSHDIIYSYTDGQGCLNSDTQTVVVNSVPIVSFSGLDSTYCHNAPNETLVGSPSGGVFSGSGIIGNDFNPAIAGAGTFNINYTYTDMNSCAGVDSQQVIVNSAPIVNAGADSTILINTSISLSGSAIAGSGSYTYTWSPATSLINANVQNPVTTSLTTTTLYTLVVIDNITNCVDSDQVLVIVSGGTLSANCTASPNIVCEGKASQLNAVGSGGSGNYTYSWTSSPAGFTSTLQNPVVNPAATTTYICAINDGSSSTSSSATVMVNSLPIVSISGINSSYCSGEPIVNLIGAPIGGTFFGQGVIGSTFNPAIVSAGSHDIVYSFIDLNGCGNSDTVNLTLNLSPIADAGSDSLISCGLASYIPIGSMPIAGLTYSWTPIDSLSDPTISNPLANPNMTTMYTVVVTDAANGCISTDDVIISVIGGPTAYAGNDTSICFGENLILNASGGINYLWSTGDTTASITVTPTVDTYYVVVVTDTVSNCASSDTVMVIVDHPIVDFGADTSICDQSIVLDAGVGFASYVWSTGATTQMIIADTTGIGYGTGTFSVTVTNAAACITSDEINIIFKNCTGLGEITDDLKVNLYPNPTQGKFQIDISGLNSGTLDMCIVNMAGQI